MTNDQPLPQQYNDLMHMAAFGMVVLGEAGAFQLGAIIRVAMKNNLVILTLVDGQRVNLNELDTQLFLNQTSQVSEALSRQGKPGRITLPTVSLR